MSSKKQATEVVTSLKGFNSKLQCREFQFEVGKTYTVSGKIEALTDELAAPAYDVLSADELDELVAGLDPIAAALQAADY